LLSYKTQRIGWREHLWQVSSELAKDRFSN
jgi:hypothetical protein